MTLANGHRWEGGVQELCQVAPDVLSIRDPVTLLYPFQLAAISHQDKWVEEDMETIFQLLRHCPELVMEMVH